MKALIASLNEAKSGDEKTLDLVWDVWDRLLGIDKYGGIKPDFYDTARSLATDLDIDGEYGSKEQKAGEAAGKALVTMERQTRKWRIAYNLWHEGRTIDKARMKRDMAETRDKMTKIFTKMDRVKRTDLAKQLSDQYDLLQSTYTATRNAFEKAEKALS